MKATKKQPKRAVIFVITLFAKYQELASKQDKVIFGGRLGMYKYFDMHQVIEVALHCAEQELGV